MVGFTITPILSPSALALNFRISISSRDCDGWLGITSGYCFEFESFVTLRVGFGSGLNFILRIYITREKKRMGIQSYTHTQWDTIQDGEDDKDGNKLEGRKKESFYY
jgi:hypothetical protein